MNYPWPVSGDYTLDLTGMSRLNTDRCRNHNSSCFCSSNEHKTPSKTSAPALLRHLPTNQRQAEKQELLGSKEFGKTRKVPAASAHAVRGWRVPEHAVLGVEGLLHHCWSGMRRSSVVQREVTCWWRRRWCESWRFLQHVSNSLTWPKNTKIIQKNKNIWELNMNRDRSWSYSEGGRPSHHFVAANAEAPPRQTLWLCGVRRSVVLQVGKLPWTVARTTPCFLWEPELFCQNWAYLKRKCRINQFQKSFTFWTNV